MGGQQSREEIEEDTGDSTIIGISEEVAKRLLRQVNSPSVKSSDSIDSIRERHATETTYLSKKEQVKMFEDYYQKQLHSLQEQNKILKETSEEQFQATIKEVENKFPEPVKKTTVCKELQNVMVKCYKENQGTTLNCSHEVKSFIDCVQKHGHMNPQETS